MFSDDDNLVIVFNGEIYNHSELRKTIGNYSYKSSSDTETILAGFKKYGTKFFSKLNGIFAFAIYDLQRNHLILCRDQFGVKPLYYYTKENELYFGSELKSFLKINDWDKSIDSSAIMNYLHFLWSPGGQTPFEHVRKFPPGHFAIIDLNLPIKLNIQQYYDIPFDGKYNNMNESE